MQGALAPALPEHPSTLLELRHASTARPMVVVVPERRLLAIHGAGTRVAADFGLATEVLRIVVDLVRASLPARPPFGLPSILEVCCSIPVPRRRRRSSSARGASPLAPDDRAASNGERDRGDRRHRHARAASRPGGAPRPAAPRHRRAGAQILHLATDPASDAVARLYEFVFQSGLQPAGDLHELVVADPAAVGRIRGRSIYRVPVSLG